MEDGYFIPKNYEDNMITGSGRSMRNVVEAVIFFAIFVLIFGFLPISVKARIVLIILFGGPAAFFGFFGIHKCSVTEYVLLWLHFKSQPKEYTREELFIDEDELEANMRSVLSDVQQTKQTNQE